MYDPFDISFDKVSELDISEAKVTKIYCIAYDFCQKFADVQ